MSHSLVDGRGAARETDNVRPVPCGHLTPVCQSAVKARRAVNMDMKPRRREMAVLAVLGALLASAALAFSIASERHARLTLLHVLERPAAEDLVDPQRYIDSTVRMLQHQVPKGLGDDCHLSYEVSQGIPSDEILKAARERGSDLIVLGVRPAPGRLGLATHLARPTAHRVVCKAGCPVLTVRG